MYDFFVDLFYGNKSSSQKKKKMNIKYPDQSTGKGNFPKYSRWKSQKCHTILFHIVASTVTCKITLTPA